MHFTYKNLDDARRDDVIDSEKLTRIPEDIMPKKDQENSIEKKMDSIDHDDKKCEMVNEQLLCRKKENSKMDQEDLKRIAVERILSQPKIAVDWILKWCKRERLRKRG